ncbi:MAG: histidine phosphatase family protein [Desulfobacterota bacterium]|nr:histidine phosphatase family protein [Thermodesulfobacteriota bacterium]
MGDLYVIRHAQASFGRDDYDQLSELGFRQAGLIETYFQKAGVRFDAVYCGSLKRQVATAEPLRSCLKADVPTEITISEAFNEYDSTAVIQTQFPHLVREDPALEQDLPRLQTDQKALQRLLERALARWLASAEPLEGLETWEGFNRRVREGVIRILTESGPGKTVALVTSGGPLSAILKMALSLSDQETVQLSWQVRNASVSTFKYNRNRLTLSSFNNVAHLEISGEPGLVTYR